MIVMHPKKESLLKTVSMANWRRWGARGGSWERAGSESRGRPRPIGWPTARTASADRVDSVGRPGGRPCVTTWTASADKADGLGRPPCRARPRPCTCTCGRAPVRLGDAVEGFASTGRGGLPALCGRVHCDKRGTAYHCPTHLNGRAGRFGIFCLIACVPLSVVVDFRTTYFSFSFSIALCLVFLKYAKE